MLERWRAVENDGRHGHWTFRTLTLHLEIDIGNIAVVPRKISTCALHLGARGLRNSQMPAKVPPAAGPRRRGIFPSTAACPNPLLREISEAKLSPIILRVLR